MELLKVPSSGGLKISDALHVGANALFVAALGLLIFVWQLTIVAFLLAIFSKWRILAVRPRYWGVNIRSNLPDLIFIVSTVGLAISPLATNVASQAAWLTLLAVWLLVIKPRSNQDMMLIQSLMVQFVGITALFAYASFIASNQLFAFVTVTGGWIIGYAAARHAISSYESEARLEFFALLWGFIVAQLVWLFGHWLQVYTLAPGFEIPQLALLILLLSFCAQRAYNLQRQVIVADDRAMRKVATKQALKSAYTAAGFALTLIVIILLTTSWTITI